MLLSVRNLEVCYGVISALQRNRWPDIVVKVVALVSASIPVFWLGLALLYIFYYQLSWLPGFGRIDKDITPPSGPTTIGASPPTATSPT